MSAGHVICIQPSPGAPPEAARSRGSMPLEDEIHAALEGLEGCTYEGWDIGGGLLNFFASVQDPGRDVPRLGRALDAEGLAGCYTLAAEVEGSVRVVWPPKDGAFFWRSAGRAGTDARVTDAAGRTTAIPGEAWSRTERTTDGEPHDPAGLDDPGA